MITNREWMKSLTVKQLVKFLTTGLEVTPKQPGWAIYKFIFRFKNVADRATSCKKLIRYRYTKEWLDAPQEFIVAKKEK